MEHSISLEKNRDKRWIARCSCGRWTSNKYLLRGEAESVGEIHIFKGDGHLRALAQFNRGKSRVNLAAELRWYEEQANAPHNSKEVREQWAMLADELRPRVIVDDPDDQLTLWDPE